MEKTQYSLLLIKKVHLGHPLLSPSAGPRETEMSWQASLHLGAMVTIKRTQNPIQTLNLKVLSDAQRGHTCQALDSPAPPCPCSLILQV